ncbi:hypothetical protein CP10139811_0549 [Chlamydia ibidis]|uniref:GYF domain-containing protein n=2 Tax=Chlamydia ibidis TaxID=1405396 RepID=S7J2A4_9CHLA|nr:DUF4339 domain-containing protein [Chlamydia ibidis]EPP34554.1 hypothetical protein CP10139811_0549 [Chlamydia ibidis]EQM62402.1 hypothetical protein H359_0930 [Chlamydia ibidis 10-1398/6]
MLPSILPISFFLFYILLGIATSYIAIKKNRNPIGWFIGGALFGIFAILILCMLPSINSKDNPNNSSLSTDDGEPMDNTFQEILENSSSSSTNLLNISTERWFYLDSERRNVGPLTTERLLAFLQEENTHNQANNGPGDIWVWRKGMSEWKKVKDVSELREALKILK